MDDLEKITRNFSALTERVPNLAKEFYDRFFAEHPEVKELFTLSPAAQQQMLNESLVAVIDHLGDADWVQSNMRSLGIRHLDYEVAPEMYDWWADVLLRTLRELSGGDWSAELERVWRSQLAAICALARDARLEPLQAS